MWWRQVAHVDADVARDFSDRFASEQSRTTSDRWYADRRETRSRPHLLLTQGGRCRFSPAPALSDAPLVADLLERFDGDCGVGSAHVVHRDRFHLLRSGIDRRLVQRGGNRSCHVVHAASRRVLRAQLWLLRFGLSMDPVLSLREWPFLMVARRGGEGFR